MKKEKTKMEKAKKVLRIIAMILSTGIHAVYYFVLNTEIYVDRAMMPTGDMKVWHLSPIERLESGGKGGILTCLIWASVISIITSVLVLFGVNKKVIRIVQIVSTVASVVLFVVSMYMSSKVHLRY